MMDFIHLQLEWFANAETFQFITHAVGRTTSPACVFVQEYCQQGNGAGTWAPAIPNNAFLATLISFVSVQSMSS